MYKRLVVVAVGLLLTLSVLPGVIQAQDRERDTSAQSKEAYLGIVAESTPQSAEHEGAVIRAVTPNSPAAKAGLKRGDIITKVGDKEINDFEDLLNCLSQHKPGEKVNLEVFRNDQSKQLLVTLAQRPAQRNLRSGENAPSQEDQERQSQGYYGRRRPTAFLGVQSEELTPEVRHREGISAQQGVVVMEVLPNSPAEQAGLREGDVITKVDDESITNPQDLREAIQKAGPGHDVKLDVMRGRRHRELTAHLERGSAEFAREYGLSPFDQSREIQRLQQRIQQLERRLRRLEQNRSEQSRQDQQSR